MMTVTGGSTDVSTYFVMRLAADGTEATGLTITNFDLQYTRSGVAPTAKVDATALAATDTAHTDNYAIEIDATDQPGLYRVDWPDAAFAAGVKEVILSVKCATCFTEHLRVMIDAPVNATKVGSQTASASGTVTFPNATLASTTNITAGTVTTATNVTTVNGLAANVITAASMAADASAEIADAVWDEDATGHQTGGTFGQAIGDPGASTETLFKAIVTDPAGTNIAADIIAIKAETASILEDTGTTLQAELDGIQADTEDIQSRLPAALVNSRMDCTIDGTGMETGAVDSILNRDASASTTNSTLGAIVNDWENGGRLDLIVDAILDDTDLIDDGTSGLAKIATDVAAILVDTAEIGAAGAGLTNINLPNQTMDIVGNITGNLSGSVGSVAGAVGSVTGLTAADVGAILADTNELQTDWVNGGRLDLILDARASQTSVDDLPTNAELATSQAAADDATLAAIAALNNLSAAQVNAEVDTALADVGLTTTITGRIDAAITTRMATYTQPTGFLAASFPTDPADASVIAARFDTLDTSVADLPTNAELATALGTADDAVLAAVAALNNLSAAGVRTAIGLASANLDTQLADLPTNAELATALGTADDAVLAQIALVKAKTDSLTFTVAGQVDANVQYVNDVQVDGVGTGADPWGPA